MKRAAISIVLGVVILAAGGLAVLPLLGWLPHGAAPLQPAAAAATAGGCDEPIQAVPDPPPLDPQKVALGKRLFHDPLLSHDGTVSCATCHNLDRGGTDGQPYSRDGSGPGDRLNAPTVFNSSLNFRQFWDGRAASLDEQIEGPIHNPQEFASDWAEIIPKLRGDAGYAAAFNQLYADGIQTSTIKDAIVTFERSLLTPNSRFDRYLRGDKNAITEEEREGYRRFCNYGCVSCHQGSGVGGNMFAKFGVMDDCFAARGNVAAADLGRYNVTGRDCDRHCFKVPSLRNVARTAPYFHDGSAANLARAVNTMARYQLGRNLSADDVALIVKFLETLTGEYNGHEL
jgi:cytochrome c peroxidase